MRRLRFRRTFTPAMVAVVMMALIAIAVEGIGHKSLIPATNKQGAVVHSPFLSARTNAIADAASLKQAAADPSADPGLPAPSGQLPGVAPATAPWEVDAVVALPATATPQEIQALQTTPGIGAIEEVDTGTVQVNGAPVNTFGVDPGTFRNFTPPPSQSDDALWQYIAGGSLASSFNMASDRKLSLGSRLPIIPANGQPPTNGWMGAFISTGIPNVDMLVDNGESAALGLTHNGGLVISAAQMNPQLLQTTLASVLPGSTATITSPQLLNPPTAPNAAAGSGNFIGPNITGTSTLSAQTITAVIQAALAQVGKPYVWGGTGPNGFDCSGLVGWAYAMAGIPMPRTSEQDVAAGYRIPYAQAQPGDLLEWNYDPANPSDFDHMAIYLGGGQMVVAPHTGTDVQVAPVTTDHLNAVIQVVPAMAAAGGGGGMYQLPAGVTPPPPPPPGPGQGPPIPR